MDSTDVSAQVAIELSETPLLHNLMTLRTSLMASDSFVLDYPDMELFDGTGTVSIPLSRLFMMDDILNELEELLSVKVLGVCTSEDGVFSRTVAYSESKDDEMFSVTLTSFTHGIVEEVDFTFFESIETMFDRLKKSRNGMLREGLKTNRLQSLTELFQSFY